MAVPRGIRIGRAPLRTNSRTATNNVLVRVQKHPQTRASRITSSPVNSFSGADPSSPDATISSMCTVVAASAAARRALSQGARRRCVLGSLLVGSTTPIRAGLARRHQDEEGGETRCVSRICYPGERRRSRCRSRSRSNRFISMTATRIAFPPRPADGHGGERGGVPGHHRDAWHRRGRHRRDPIRGQAHSAGERRNEKDHRGQSTYRLYRSQQAFRRLILMPCPIDAGQVEASLRRGVLTISLPKADGVRGRRRISVKGPLAVDG